MDKCIDTKLGEQLFAYELGVLDEESLARFEVHLLECNYCRARAESCIPVEIGRAHV